MTEWEEDCLKYWGKVLTGKHGHWCYDFDDLPIDETCQEFEFCTHNKFKLMTYETKMSERIKK